MQHMFGQGKVIKISIKTETYSKQAARSIPKKPILSICYSIDKYRKGDGFKVTEFNIFKNKKNIDVSSVN